MTNTLPAPVDRRSMATAAAIGGCVGLAIGSAYVAGALARASVEDAQARLVAGTTALPALRGEPSLRASAPAPRPVPALARVPALALARALPTQVDLRERTAAPARDLECLSQAVYYEARGEEERGRKAVAQVVINRTRQPRFPRSICGVVFQHAQAGCAFSFACDGQTRRRLEPEAWRDARRIAQLMLAGFAMPELRTATDFRGGGGGPPPGLARVAQIGGHVFYRWTGRIIHPALPRTAPAVAATPAAPSAPTPTLVKADAPIKPDAAAAAATPAA